MKYLIRSLFLMAVLLAANPVLSFEPTFRLTEITEFSESAEALMGAEVLTEFFKDTANLLTKSDPLKAGKYKLILRLDVKQQLADYNTELAYIYLVLPENKELNIAELKSFDKDARLAKADDFYILELDPIDNKQVLTIKITIELEQETPVSAFSYGILAKTTDGRMAEYLNVHARSYHKLFFDDFLEREFKKQELAQNRIQISINGTLFKHKVKDWNSSKNNQLTRQLYDYSCGAASVSTIFSYFYNKPIGEKEVLVEVMEIKGMNNKDPGSLNRNDYFLNFLDLQKYVEKQGFSAKGISLPMESLRKLKVPAIVYVKIRNNQHFSVFRGMDDTYVYLADSTFGNLKIKLDKFKQIFYTRKDLKFPGKLLAIIPKKKADRKNTNKKFMQVVDDRDTVQEMIEDGIIRSIIN